MKFLPVVARELRVASRRAGTFWTRFGVVVIALILCVCTWMTFDAHEKPYQRGKVLFYFIGGLSFVFCLWAGAMITADSLSEEKREGTLGLLFLTDLKGYDVVLGKLVATSLVSFYALIATFPLMAVPVTLGGLTGGDVYRMALVLVNTLFFSLTAGLLASALCKSGRKAALTTALIILLVNAGPPLFGLILSLKTRSPGVEMEFLVPSAGTAFAYASDVLYASKASPSGKDIFWISAAITHVLAWCWLILASVIVKHSWQDKPAGATKLRWYQIWQRLGYGDPATRAAYRRRLLNVNPYYWLSARNRLKVVYALAALGLLGALWLWFAVKFKSEVLEIPGHVTTMFILHSLLKFWVGSDACRPLAEDRKGGTLELVLSTPLSVAEILNGQLRALVRNFGIPLLIVLLADIAMLAHGSRHADADVANWVLAVVVLIAVLLADLYSMAWVGMWLGLTSRRASWATSSTFARILALPWAVFIGLIILLAVIQPGSFNPSFELLVTAFFVIALLTDVFFTVWARINLLDRFRTIAAQRFMGKKKGDAIGA